MILFGRRNFVRGLGLGAGAALLAPFARSLVASAGGQPSTKRWVLVHDQLGLGHDTAERWIPNAADLTAEGALPTAFAPLAPWAAETLIIDRLHNPFNQGQHGNGWAHLSMVSSVAADPDAQQSEDAYPNPGGITVDIFAGEALSAGAPFRTIGVSTDNSGQSSDAQLNEVPHFRSVTGMYSQVFGSFDPDASAAEIEARLQRRLSVLDTATEDLVRMRSRLAGPEREKLDQYEDSIRALEDQLAALADAGMCTLPPMPNGEANDAGPHNGPLPPGFLEAMVAIQATALICRLTNVVVLRPSPGRRTYAELFGHNDDKHNFSHANDDAVLADIDSYNATLLAQLLTALDQVPEGDGTMRDSTLATWVDSGGGRHHGGYDDHPVIIVGDLGGHFVGGRYVQFPKFERALSDAFVSVLQALDVDVDTFGDPGVCQGPLPGLT